MTPRRLHQGFTLAEMLIAVALLAIGLAAAMPSFSRLVASQRLSAGANEIVGTLHYGKMEAVRVRGRVVACPTRGGNNCDGGTNWSQAIVFVDTNRNGSRDGNEVVGRRWDLQGNGLTLTQLTGTSPARIVFGAAGLARPGSAGAAMTNLRLCAGNLPNRSNLVEVTAGGARTRRSNGDGCNG